MARKRKRCKLSEEQKSEIRVLYKTGKFSNAYIADMYGVWPTTVTRLTKDIDLPRKHVKNVTPEEHLEMIRLFNQGMKYREIGHRLGYRYGTVRTHVLRETDAPKALMKI